MARLVHEGRMQATFSVRLDIENVTEVVQAARRAVVSKPPTVTVVYVGEAHSNAFDVARRKAMIAALTNEANVLIVVERTLAIGSEGPRMVVERNEYSSADDGRNLQVANWIAEDISERKLPSVIVIFFGADHLAKLQRHLLSALDKDLQVRWQTMPPVDEFFGTTLPRHSSTFSTVGNRPVGYCDLDSAPYQMIFLEKGYVPEPFLLELYMPRDVFGASIYAVYYKDPADEAKQRAKVDTDGYAEIKVKCNRIDGSRIIVAKKITRDQIDAAEKGILNV